MARPGRRRLGLDPVRGGPAMIRPRYPVYVISKGRADRCLTARFLVADQVDFRLVVEPQEADAYAARYGRDRLEILPFANLGQGSIPARNWVWEHARAAGAEKHWILDDNIGYVVRRFHGERIRCESGPALACIEDLADRYANLAIAGLNYKMFATRYDCLPPFMANVHVYSCMLIRNDLPFRWRGRYNEDADLVLQVLSAGLCTILVNAFLIDKMASMTMKGGKHRRAVPGRRPAQDGPVARSHVARGGRGQVAMGPAPARHQGSVEGVRHPAPVQARPRARPVDARRRVRPGAGRPPPGQERADQAVTWRPGRRRPADSRRRGSGPRRR